MWVFPFSGEDQKDVVASLCLKLISTWYYPKLNFSDAIGISVECLFMAWSTGFSWYSLGIWLFVPAFIPEECYLGVLSILSFGDAELFIWSHLILKILIFPAKFGLYIDDEASEFCMDTVLENPWGFLAWFGVSLLHKSQAKHWFSEVIFAGECLCTWLHLIFASHSTSTCILVHTDVRFLINISIIHWFLFCFLRFAIMGLVTNYFGPIRPMPQK